MNAVKATEFPCPQPLILDKAAAGEQAACRPGASAAEKREQLPGSLPGDDGKRGAGTAQEARGWRRQSRHKPQGAPGVPGTTRQQSTAPTLG